MRETKSKQELAFVNANFSENPTCSPNAPLKATREASRGGFAHEHWPTPKVHPCSRLLVGVFVAVRGSRAHVRFREISYMTGLRFCEIS